MTGDNKRARLPVLFVAMSLGFALARSAVSEEPRPGPPPQATDDSMTPFACSTDTLLSGVRCTLEYESPKSADAVGVAEKNVKAASVLGVRMCPRVARLRDEDAADADLERYCEYSFRTAASASCSLEGERALLDDSGHFAEGASQCYEALSQVLSRTRSMAALTVKCCRCAAKACSLTVGQCNERMIRGAASDATAECARNSCADACEVTPGLKRTPVLTPNEPQDDPMAPPPYWRRRGPVWPWY